MLLKLYLIIVCDLLVFSVKTHQCPTECVCSVDNTVTNCSNANLANVPREEFDTETIVLDLSRNLLKIVRNFTFLDRKLYSIETLDLSNNKHLSSIELNAFEAMTNIKYLDLSYDDFSKISPHVFKQFKKHLEVLILSHNRYLELPNGGFQLPKLRELHLENTGLENLPEDFFENTKNLQLINLRNNKLSTFESPIFESLKSLKTLILKNNTFTTLSLGLLKLPGSLNEMDISDNPWMCDCNHKTLTFTYEKNIFVQNLTCTSPKAFNNRKFTKELAADLLCDTTTTVTTTLETTTTTTGSKSIVEPFLRSKAGAEPLLLRGARIQIQDDQMTTLSEETSSVADIVRVAGVSQGNGESWLSINQWWIISLSCVAAMTVGAIVVIKKLNSFRSKRSNEVGGLDDEYHGFKTDTV